MLLDNLHAVTVIAGTIGTIISALIGIYATVRRSSFGTFFRSQIELTLENHDIKQKLEIALERATSAESLSATYRDTVAEMRQDLDKLQREFASLSSTIAPLQVKVDAMVDWAHLAIDHSTRMDELLRTAGINHNERLPEIPSVMKDRFNIPETLR